jgi:hypothetical protein
VPEGHPAFGRGRDDVDAELPDGVHGGLTYAAPCQEDEREHGICHVPEPGQPDRVWWLGFDTAHAFDRMPAMEGRLRRQGFDGPPFPGDRYRTLRYVQAECGRLAAQLDAMACR